MPEEHKHKTGNRPGLFPVTQIYVTWPLTVGKKFSGKKFLWPHNSRRKTNPEKNNLTNALKKTINVNYG
jgi:hypothetical protein